MRKSAHSIAVGILALAGTAISGSAAAHTSSLGYVPGATPGSVTFWAGSYEHGSTVFNEGTFTLTGISDPTFIQVVAANVLPTNTRPTGLVDGTNNFFWAVDPFSPTGYSFPNSVDPIIFGLGIAHWQGISFTGLTPGTYSFTCGLTCGSTQQWASLDGRAVQVTLTGRDIGGAVPEPSTWMLLMLGFFGTGLALRRRKTTTSVSYA